MNRNFKNEINSKSASYLSSDLNADKIIITIIIIVIIIISTKAKVSIH